MDYIDKRVSFSEIGPDCKIKLGGILDYFQDAVICQSEDLGVGVKAIMDEGYCWVLSSWQVVVDRYPDLDERVLVGTAPYEFKGFMGMRNFVMKTADGEILARANSIWPFVEWKTTKLTRIPEHISAAYTCDEKIDMEYASRKIKLPDAEPVQAQPITAMYHCLDSNNHVNNARYISMAEDVLPEGRRAGQVRAEYRSSAHEGDIIVPLIYHGEGSSIYTVSLNDEGGSPYTIVEFTL